MFRENSQKLTGFPIIQEGFEYSERDRYVTRMRYDERVIYLLLSPAWDKEDVGEIGLQLEMHPAFGTLIESLTAT